MERPRAVMSTYVGALQDDEAIGNAKIELFLNEQTLDPLTRPSKKPEERVLLQTDGHPDAERDKLL